MQDQKSPQKDTQIKEQDTTEQQQLKQQEEEKQPILQQENINNENNDNNQNNELSKENQEKIDKETKQEEIRKQNNTMKYGDMVIMYISHDQQKQILLTEGEIQGTQFGQFPHENFVGREYGSKINCKGKGGFVYALKPSPSLITSSLSHKTQIIYQSDIATIIFKLNIIPGSKVIESGTGSGSLSSAIATTIQEKGHLYTFEFSQERVENGKQLFKRFKFNNVNVIHRDAIGEGFLNKEGENYDVLNSDAVFLDLPAPWKAIHHAKAVLRKGGKLACYSPCIEQAQRNVQEIWNQGFTHCHTIEVVQRVHERQFQEFKSAFEVNEVNVKRKRDEAFPQEDNNNNENNNNKNSNSIGMPKFVNKQFVQSYGHSFGHTAYLTFATLL